MASDRANPASPWPDIRRESWLERLRRGVSTARAYPLHERGANQGPLGVAVNDLAASVPLPDDFSAMGDMAMRLMDPTGMYGNADAQGFDAAGALANPENLRAMMEYAGEHPVQTMASAFGGPAGIAAYRRMTPSPYRAGLHALYGRGRPMTYLRPEDASVIRALASAESGEWNNKWAGAGNVVRDLISNITPGKPVPRGMKYMRPRRDIAHKLAVEQGMESGSPLTAGTVAGREMDNMWTAEQTVGGAFFDPEKTRVYDSYRFYPMPEYQFAVNGRPTGFADAAEAGALELARFLQSMKFRNPAMSLRRATQESGGFERLMVPAIMNSPLYKPYLIDASLTSGDALMEGLAPFSAIGATGEMLPPWMRSAAQPDAIRQSKR